jgi:hypothetical protein
MRIIGVVGFRCTLILCQLSILLKPSLSMVMSISMEFNLTVAVNMDLQTLLYELKK